MVDEVLANAERWSKFWNCIENIAFGLTVLFLAIQFVAVRFGVPYKQQIEKAKDERMATLSVQQKTAESELAKSNIEIARAHVAVEEARALAKEAELALERLKRARTIDPKKFEWKLLGKPPLRVEIFWLAEISDGWVLAGQMERILIEIGWTDTVSQKIETFPDEVTVAFVDDKVGSGIVMMHSRDLSDDKEDDGMHKSFSALMDAITATLGAGTWSMSTGDISSKTVRIYIGPKL